MSLRIKISGAVPCSQNVTENKDFLEHPKNCFTFLICAYCRYMKNDKDHFSVLKWDIFPILCSIQNSVIPDEA